MKLLALVFLTEILTFAQITQIPVVSGKTLLAGQGVSITQDSSTASFAVNTASVPLLASDNIFAGNNTFPNWTFSNGTTVRSGTITSTNSFLSGGTFDDTCYNFTAVDTLDPALCSTGTLVKVQLGDRSAATSIQAASFAPLEGSAPSAITSSSPIYADSTQHELYAATRGTANFGMIHRSMPGAIHLTTQTAAVSTATLCAAANGACNVAGQYHVHWDFIETGTACGTPGSGGVTFLLTWTDTNATTHSAISLPMNDSASITATSGTFTFRTTLAAAWASGDFNISTNGTIIQYATGYTACGAGTGTYQLDVTVKRMQ